MSAAGLGEGRRLQQRGPGTIPKTLYSVDSGFEFIISLLPLYWSWYCCYYHNITEPFRVFYTVRNRCPRLLCSELASENFTEGKSMPAATKVPKREIAMGQLLSNKINNNSFNWQSVSLLWFFLFCSVSTIRERWKPRNNNRKPRAPGIEHTRDWLAP